MRKRVTVLALLVPFILPVALAAQGFGIGVKAGTLGVGLEGALALGGKVNLRVGGGMLPYDPTLTLGDIEFDIDLPDKYFNVGLDLYPTGGGFRLMGGLIYKPDEMQLEASFTKSQDIGGFVYTPAQIGTLAGSVESGSLAPFVGIGFGRHTASGVGIFVDLGASFVGEPELTLTSVGGSLTGAEKTVFNGRLETERQQTEDDMGGYLKIYPVLQLGLRIGVGG